MKRDYKNFLYPKSDKDEEALISFQFDRADVAKAESIMDDIVKNINIDGYTSTDKTVANKVKELSKVLSGMVEFNVSLTYSAATNFCTYIIPAKANDALLNNVNYAAEYYESTKSDGSISEEYYKKNDTIDSMLGRGYEVLNNTLSTTGIKVDLDRGKIFGISKDFYQLVLVDFAYVLDTYKLTARECLACIMHEIGHTFTYYQQLGSVYANMTTLLDTIKEEYLVRNSSARETITLAYNKISKNNKDIDDKPTEEVIIDLGRIILTPDTNVTSKEVESKSDVFAARYGFGEELATALVKMVGGTDRSKSVISNIFAIMLMIVATAIWIYLMVVSVIMMSTLVLYPFGYILLICSNMLFDVVMNSDYATTSWGGIPNDFSRYDSGDYDSMYDRINRIKQQIIATLKVSELSNNEIKAIIRQLDSLSKLTESLKHNKPLFAKIKTLFGSKKMYKLDTHYIVEALFNSDLIIASARLKTI
jgi:hypothetical protein